MSMIEELKQFEAAKLSLIAKLKDGITEIGKVDNNAITRLNEKCYTIRKSDLHKDLNLAPHFYDYAMSCQMIIEVMPKDVSKFKDFIENIIESEKLPLGNKHANARMHPELIKRLENEFNL